VLSGRLLSGAVASVQYRGGTVPNPRFRWEIQGDAGSLEIVNDTSTLNRGNVVVREHRLGEPPRDLTIPDSYDHYPALRGTQGHVVAHAYAAIIRDLDEGTRVAPRFTDALRLHEILDAAERASRNQASAPTRRR
jgi:predicted dehydrogenase